MPFMWADTLMSAERFHCMRLLVWSAANILTGTAMLTWLRAGGRQSALLHHFAMQCVIWGVVIAAIAAAFVTHLHPRDVAEATRLDRMLWLTIGLDLGCAALGGALIVCAWRLGRRYSIVGAGIAIVIQGLGLMVINLSFVAVISR